MISYEPKPFTEEVNYTRKSPVVQLFKLLACLGALFVGVFILLGMSTDFLAGFVPVSWEKSIGEMYDSAFPVNMHDPRTRRLHGLLEQLTPHMEESDSRLTYSICVEDNSMVNAMALPGGRIVVFSGLLRELRSDQEILFVLAHELGHFHHRDHLRRLGRGLITLLISSMIPGPSGGSASGVVDVIANSMNMAYSRSQERDADLYALELLYKATGSTQGAEAFMRRLESMEPDLGLLYFFSTHPSPAERREYISEASAWYERGE
ncbi:MAG: hypothetical protein D6E12_10910 [Desulfovibrio sp.]|nr:MAG: hypothetical protein D6E12_10910 [Desulfovibrio sp.]